MWSFVVLSSLKELKHTEFVTVLNKRCKSKWQHEKRQLCVFYLRGKVKIAIGVTEHVPYFFSKMARVLAKSCSTAIKGK